MDWARQLQDQTRNIYVLGLERLILETWRYSQLILSRSRRHIFILYQTEIESNPDGNYSPRCLETNAYETSCLTFSDWVGIVGNLPTSSIPTIILAFVVQNTRDKKLLVISVIERKFPVCRNSLSKKTWIFAVHACKAIADDGMETQGAKALLAMPLTQLPGNILLSAQERSICWWIFLKPGLLCAASELRNNVSSHK